MSQVTKSYREALTLPPPGDGSDIIGQYRLAQEYGTQLGAQYALGFVLLTDGFQTVGAGALDHPLAAKEATQLAERLDLPKLPGASVVVAGLGKVAGTPPSSDVVEGVVRFYDAICARTGAAECRSVTDFTVGGDCDGAPPSDVVDAAVCGRGGRPGRDDRWHQPSAD
jgi:hypothetical protein